jgi:ankyrin repeat protein
MNTCNFHYFFVIFFLPYTLSGVISCASKQYLNTELLRQTKQGNFFAVSDLLDQGANPNATYAYNSTILSSALFYKEYTIAELLLDSGANPNAQNVFGSAPLHAAIALKDIIALQLLLRYNANPNIQDRLGNTPLHDAVYRGEPEIVQLLLEHGADLHMPNIQDKAIPHRLL